MTCNIKVWQGSQSVDETASDVSDASGSLADHKAMILGRQICDCCVFPYGFSFGEVRVD